MARKLVTQLHLNLSHMHACLQETLAKLPKLQRLVATNNQLRTLPIAFGHMRHIKELNLGCAQ